MSGEQQSNGGDGNSKMEGYDTGGRNGSAQQQQPQNAGAAMAPMIGNINSPSVSLASVSSDGSTESYVVEPEEMFALTQEVKRLKEALSRLRKVFHADMDRTETTKVACHERLGEVLKILRQLLEKYPLLQSNELVGSAGRLIQVTS
jgi:Rho GTPase-activating protein 29/45